MQVLVAGTVYFCWWVACGIVWVLYYIGVALFYLIGALYTVIAEAIRGRQAAAKSKREFAQSTSQVVENMYGAGDRARERMRQFAP